LQFFWSSLAGQRLRVVSAYDGNVFLYDRASALILVIYIIITICNTLEGERVSISQTLDNSLFSSVTGASCSHR
jgi:succinate dehydrogenase hydrophobic anchor subunit